MIFSVVVPSKIKSTPHRSFTFEKLPHCEVVKPVGAVEHDALLGQGLGQILGRFRLPGTGRACRGPSKNHLKHDRDARSRAWWYRVMPGGSSIGLAKKVEWIQRETAAVIQKGVRYQSQVPNFATSWNAPDFWGSRSKQFQVRALHQECSVSVVHLQRAHDGEVALVRQRRDHQPEGVAEVLIAVLPLARYHHNLFVSHILGVFVMFSIRNM